MQIRMRLAAAAAILLVSLAGAAPALAQQQPPPAGQDEYVPAAQLPAVEQLPAAPMVIAAYGFVWVALLVYVWSIWRRVRRIEHEIAELARRVGSAQE